MSITLTLSVCALLGAASGDITWELEYEAARTRAAEEQRVIFVAVHTDSEARSENFWKDVYKDKRVQAESEGTVNLLACLDAQGQKTCTCARRGGLKRDQARYLEAAIREELLRQNNKGVVASPQHLWLKSNGEVLLSAPYELTSDEMVWCFATAQRLADRPRDSTVEGGRPPMRLLAAEAYKPPPGDAYGRGLNPDELKLALKQLKGSLGSADSIGRFIRVAFTDDKSAQDYVHLELQSGYVTWAGSRTLMDSLTWLSVVAPTSGWEPFAYYAGHHSSGLRKAASAGLEQLAAPKAIKAIKKALRKEKDPGVEKNWLRALGSCGRSDSSVRRQLLGVVKREKDELLRANAIFALGWLDRHEDVIKALRELLLDGELPPRLRAAAACAMALARDATHLPYLERARTDEGLDEQPRAAVEAAQTVLRGDDLRGLEPVVTDVLGDSLPRSRMFFRSVEPGEDSR